MLGRVVTCRHLRLKLKPLTLWPRWRYAFYSGAECLRASLCESGSKGWWLQATGRKRSTVAIYNSVPHSRGCTSATAQLGRTGRRLLSEESEFIRSGRDSATLPKIEANIFVKKLLKCLLIFPFYLSFFDKQFAKITNILLIFFAKF